MGNGAGFSADRGGNAMVCLPPAATRTKDESHLHLHYDSSLIFGSTITVILIRCESRRIDRDNCDMATGQIITGRAKMAISDDTGVNCENSTRC